MKAKKYNIKILILLYVKVMMERKEDRRWRELWVIGIL